MGLRFSGGWVPRCPGTQKARRRHIWVQAPLLSLSVRSLFLVAGPRGRQGSLSRPSWQGRALPAALTHPRVPSQVSVPPGALDCWVFLSCLEVLQRIEGCCDRAQMDSNIAHTVGLWSYATEKVLAGRGSAVAVGGPGDLRARPGVAPCCLCFFSRE